MKCYVCGMVASKTYRQKNMCDKHNRFRQMQRTARIDNKYVPSLFELEAICPTDMKCQDCNQIMNWIDFKNRNFGAVLQHYRDGSLGIVCMSCNTKHGAMPGDLYKQIPIGHKLCVSCKKIKSLKEFYVRRDSKKEYPMSKCKICNLSHQRKWREQNPEKYKQTTKRNNQLRNKEKHESETKLSSV